MIVGVGVDLLSIARIRRIVLRGSRYSQRFSRRILCDRELAGYQMCTADDLRTGFLASRWCLKEAVYKAAYPLQILQWDDVCIYKDGPKPLVHVKWNADLAAARVHVSLSHDDDLLVGYAVVEK
ncbi:hypothetical protein J3B02_001203 [Coemansia erecta]|uniref:4'-phosphopantetheinyl transferase domain-containing protein n=1 Tax=Coemansia asiatica TaxID=1052880 RepID=A0A9W7XIK2_9FUNG|nr:hypothetical protein LPJ64_003019 [Coemansia asiatica]KAJ2857111.1 hypothetical protein J3B02_001203 [Coemansia erecta]